MALTRSSFISMASANKSKPLVVGNFGVIVYLRSKFASKIQIESVRRVVLLILIGVRRLRLTQMINCSYQRVAAKVFQCISASKKSWITQAECS